MKKSTQVMFRVMDEDGLVCAVRLMPSDDGQQIEGQFNRNGDVIAWVWPLLGRPEHQLALDIDADLRALGVPSYIRPVVVPAALLMSGIMQATRG